MTIRKMSEAIAIFEEEYLYLMMVNRKVAEATEFIINRYKQRRGIPVVCCHCGGETKDDYMLQDEIWYRAWPTGKGCLHLKCVEELLGRKLVASDFKDIAMNSAVLYFLRDSNDHS